MHGIETVTDVKLAAVRLAIDAQAKQVAQALAAADKAVSKAEAATEKRFESVNEFRLTLSDQTKNFVSRVEFEGLRDANAARIAELSSRLDKTEGKSVGLTAGWVYLLGAVSVVCTVVSLAIAIFARTN